MLALNDCSLQYTAEIKQLAADDMDNIISESLVDWDDFDYGNYRTSEQTVLKPQLEQLGFTVGEFVSLEDEYPGPGIRACGCQTRSGKTKVFIYG